MEIIHTRPASGRGPAEWFTGEVWIDVVALPPPPSRVRLMSVHFAPGARAGWHSHPLGQAIHVTEGVGLAQSRGGPVETIRAGDTVWFAPGEEHWHGASPDYFMTHLALHEVGDAGNAADWGALVTDEEYRAGAG